MEKSSNVFVTKLVGLIDKITSEWGPSPTTLLETFTSLIRLLGFRKITRMMIEFSEGANDIDLIFFPSRFGFALSSQCLLFFMFHFGVLANMCCVHTAHVCKQVPFLLFFVIDREACLQF